MHNKPNLLIAKMNVTSFITKDYGNKRLCRCVKTKPIQTQYKANTNPICRKAKMNVTSILTKDYESERLRTPPKQTQTNPTCRGVASGEAGSNPTCSELVCPACPELVEGVEPISNRRFLGYFPFGNCGFLS